MPQLQLPLFPHGATEISKHLATIREGETITYLYGHLPIFTHHKDDVKTFRMITSQIYVNGCATQSELCRAFGITPISIKRSVKLYRREGTAGFYKERNTRGASVLTQEVLSKAQEILNDGQGISEAATKLGIKKDTMRKAVKSGRLQEVKKKVATKGA